ncbi:NUDIX domain-containing protein [Bacillus spongiae]|uniref:NUDIX domain-containing protein n=1 Tax=Bacillus spongiae TaxID=2683610 RepID=A0ABU8HC88_9BACI
METEKLTIFNENYERCGIATREEVHKKGYWHETFHCWVMKREDEVDYLYFQLRSRSKKDYPYLFDITAAGHILAHETIKDGVREIEEEIGLAVSFSELIEVGQIRYSVHHDELIDNELANVFLYLLKGNVEWKLQKEEVAGIGRVPIQVFSELIEGKRTEVKIEGFEINECGEQQNFNKVVQMHHFVPHERSFYKTVLERMNRLNQVGREGGVLESF